MTTAQKLAAEIAAELFDSGAMSRVRAAEIIAARIEPVVQDAERFRHHECGKDPLAWAVFGLDGEFDYMTFANQGDADSTVEGANYNKEFPTAYAVPLYPLPEPPEVTT